MNLNETRALVAEMRELDPLLCQNTAPAMNRKAEAWQPLLHTVGYDEALAAARDFYQHQTGTTTTIKPGDLIRLVHDRRRAMRPMSRETTCGHTIHTICQNCDATSIAAYYDAHPQPGSDAREFPPSGGGHRFKTDDGMYCETCGMPESNRRHVAVVA